MPTLSSRRTLFFTIAAAVVIVCLVLAGYGLFRDNANDRPWNGYAWDKENNKFEWWFSQYETRRDCLEGMRYAVQQSTGYTEPIGCGFYGNNYWLVWLVTTFWGDAHFQCIIKPTTEDAAKRGVTYGPQLFGIPRTGDHYYCV
jgi:hypothetical protein